MRSTLRWLLVALVLVGLAVLGWLTAGPAYGGTRATSNSWGAVDDALRTALADARVVVTRTATTFERPTAYYRNCTDARTVGAAPLHRGDPGYRAELDGNDDGVACE